MRSKKPDIKYPLLGKRKQIDFDQPQFGVLPIEKRKIRQVPKKPKEKMSKFDEHMENVWDHGDSMSFFVHGQHKKFASTSLFMFENSS